MVDSREVIGIVLAAGRGERLRPLTDVTPKPALPFLNRALVTYSLEVLRRAGVRQIGINTFHLANEVRAAVEAWRESRSDPSLQITFSQENHLLGTGGGARRVWSIMGKPEGTVAILNGDMVADFDLGLLCARHQAEDALASLVVSPRGEGRIFIRPASGQVVGLPGRTTPIHRSMEHTEVSFCGVSFLESEAMSVLPQDPGCLLRDGLTNLILRNLPIKGLFSDGIHLDVGTPERYLAATREVLWQRGVGVQTNGVLLPEGTSLAGPLLLSPEVRIEGAAHLGPVFVAGGGTLIRGGTVASHTVAHGAELQGDCRYRLQVGEVYLPLT